MAKLDDIFSDPIFDELVSEIPRKHVERIDPEIEKFQEINTWMKAHNDKEPEKSSDLTERKLFSRLKGYREKPDVAMKLKAYDEFNLLKDVNLPEEVKTENPTSIDDILNDDALFQEDDKSKALLDLSRYKRTIHAADKISRRKRASHFEQYEPLFKLVHAELASGKRQLKPFAKEAKAGEGNSVKVGNFYINNGILLTVVRIYDDNGKNYEESRDRDLKVHVIYENGTENKAMTLLGFVSNLYYKSRHGKMVTEVTSDVMGETTVQERAAEYSYVTTGYIYVVKSLSEKPEFQSIQNLYKIGFAGESVEKRVANAENEATYLYAPVKIVATWKVQNFSARKLETTLHHLLEDKQVQIEVPTANGKFETPSEWYVIDIETLEDIVNKLIVDIQL
ncbi:MAG: GIY-YIG nuclease family protein [Streptococcaceae bacterium]|nr:GIY-YIG nuclease family protein [Streptococcaceae bacterium]